MTNVQTLRNIIAAEVDDYFKDETLLHYVNMSKKRVVSTLLRLEENSDISLRALDNLRKRQEIDVSTVTADQIYTGVFMFNVDFPEQNLEKVDYIEFDNKTPVKELTAKQLVKLKNSNNRPTSLECYYKIINGTNLSFNIYLHKQPDSSLTIEYFSTPTELVSTDVGLVDLPDRLYNAVLYGAASMALLQESVKDPEYQPTFFEQIFDKELEGAVY